MALQPHPALQGLQMSDDSLGIDAFQRYKQRRIDEEDARHNADPSGNILHPIARNPAMEQTWGPFLQALKDYGGGKVVGGKSPAGSNQLTGFSTQPYGTADSTTTGTSFTPHSYTPTLANPYAPKRPASPLDSLSTDDLIAQSQGKQGAAAVAGLKGIR